MTENKRFTYKHFDWLQWHIYKDGEFFIEVTNCEEDAKKLCELLNELHDKNEQLKQQLKTKHIVNKQYEELQKLKEENKKLHRVIEENEKMIQSIYEELTKLRGIKSNLRRIKSNWDWIMEAIQYD